MQGERANRWRKLCEQAAIEKDHDKLLELTNEIIGLLDETKRRLHREQEQKNKPHPETPFDSARS